MEAKAGPSPNYRWAILAVAGLAVFASLGLSRFSYTSILPSMQAGLHLSNTQAGGLATANLAGYTVMAIVGGALASRFGARRVVPVGLLLTCIGMVTTGLATGYGPVMAAAAYGLLTALHGLGQAVGPYLAGRLADSLATFTYSYLMAAGVAFLGGIGMLLLRWAPGRPGDEKAAVACEIAEVDLAPPL